MKILFYSPVDLRSGLGCERWHCDVTNSLKRMGYDIKIVTGNIGVIRWEDSYLKKQLQGIEYERLNFLIIFSSLIPTINSVVKLWSYIKRSDAIHFIHGFAGQDILFFFIKIFSGKKIIVGHHAPILHHSLIHNIYMKFVSRPLLNFFDAHMVLNKKEFNLLKSWNVKNVHFIPSGIDTQRFKSQDSKKDDDSLNFVSVGRYDTPQKGFDLLVEAIKIFNKSNPDNKAIFNFVGSGRGITVVEQHAAVIKNIKNHGYKSYEEMPRIYKNSDIYLLSSREEPFGLILIEAWMSGIPVLATKTEGPIDMLKENVNGWFIKKIDSQSIADSISQLYKKWEKDKKTFKKMMKNCIDTGKIYDIDITAKRMSSNFFNE